MLDKDLQPKNLYNIARETPVTAEFVSELENHPSAYRGLVLWAQLEAETGAGNPPPPPVVEETAENSVQGKPQSARGKKLGRIIVASVIVVLVVFAGVFLYQKYVLTSPGTPSVKEKALSEIDSRVGKENSVTEAEARDDHLQVVSGNGFTCRALEKSVTCWGLNNHGQLGSGAASNANVHEFMLPSPVVALAAGADHACASMERGLTCWGDNRWKQVSDLDAAIMPPTPVPFFEGKKVDSISLGDIHSCAVAAGKLYCFGSDYAGQLGSGVQGAKAGVFTEIALPEGVKALDVSAQAFATCVFTDKDKTYCFGSNADKRLTQDDTQFLKPTLMPLPVKRAGE